MFTLQRPKGMCGEKWAWRDEGPLLPPINMHRDAFSCIFSFSVMTFPHTVRQIGLPMFLKETLYKKTRLECSVWSSGRSSWGRGEHPAFHTNPFLTETKCHAACRIGHCLFFWSWCVCFLFAHWILCKGSDHWDEVIQIMEVTSKNGCERHYFVKKPPRMLALHPGLFFLSFKLQTLPHLTHLTSTNGTCSCLHIFNSGSTTHLLVQTFLSALKAFINTWKLQQERPNHSRQ